MWQIVEVEGGKPALAAALQLPASAMRFMGWAQVGWFVDTVVVFALLPLPSFCHACTPPLPRHAFILAQASAHRVCKCKAVVRAPLGSREGNLLALPPVLLAAGMISAYSLLAQGYNPISFLGESDSSPLASGATLFKAMYRWTVSADLLQAELRHLHDVLVSPQFTGEAPMHAGATCLCCG